VSQLYFQVFSTEATTMTMDFGSIEMVRIQDSSDAIVFYTAAFLLVYAGTKTGRTCGAFYRIRAVCADCILQNLSYRVCVLYSGCGDLLLEKHPAKAEENTEGLLLILMAVLAKPMMEMLRFRFFSSFTAESDTVRAVQMTKLWDGIKENLWIGHGMGSFLPDYIRR
jgi:hypothetical protein